MMCCSPDFTHPDKAFRDAEIAKQKRWIDMTHALGGSYCRVLSGQRRPELSDAEGVRLAEAGQDEAGTEESSDNATESDDDERDEEQDGAQ